MSDRECGECTACCSVMDIPRLRKGPGVTCHNLGPNGCNIYEDRPDVPCKSFSCAWLQGFFGEDHRPDKSGVIIWQSLMTYRLETVASELPGMKIPDDMMAFLESLKMPVRIERIGHEPEYLEGVTDGLRSVKG